jgi:SPP1 gp7 family putative phage head morphogenesis protein
VTAADLNKQIDRLINAQYAQLDREVRRNLMSVRKQVMAGASSMWEKAGIEPVKNVTTGVTAYVSKPEAVKYGRLEKLQGEIKGIARVGAMTDIRNLEYNGMRVYELQHNGAAWVYQQGYGLPVTDGVKVPLVAQAVYSDFYGHTFEHLLRRNWAQFADDIDATILRGLNQGKSYSQLGREIRQRTDRAYSDSLRVARTEAHRIQAMAHEDSLGLLDEVGAEYVKVWVATIDNRTRDDHAMMDGEEADKDGIFTLPSGATGPGPGLTLSAQDDINCRCTWILKLNGELPEQRRVRGEGLVPYQTFSEKVGATNVTELREQRRKLGL